MTATIEAPDGQNSTELTIPDPLSAHKYLPDPTYGYTSEDLSAAKYLLECAPTRFDQETTTFTDVAADSVYNRAISWAVTEGITIGKTADTFDPDGICTRGNIVTFLYRALAE